MQRFIKMLWYKMYLTFFYVKGFIKGLFSDDNNDDKPMTMASDR